MLSWHPYHIVKKMIIVCWSGDNSASTARLLPPTYLCHLFFSNFHSKAEWSEPACISSRYVRFEDIDESKKEGKGGEACWVGVSEWVVEEGGKEGEREREGRREKEGKMMQHNWYRCYTPPFTAMWMSKSPSVFLSLFTSNTKTCEKNNQLFSSWYFSSYFRKNRCLNGVTCTTYLKFCLQACGTACVFKLEWFSY